METQTQQNGHGQPAAQPPQQQPVASARRQYVRPRANITENDGGYLVEVEMPGVNKSGLEITFENGELTLVGHRTAPVQSELLYRESHPADFRRVFEVDSTIDAANIRAQLEQGLLTLTLPKAEAAKPRRIEINSLN